MTIMVVQNLRFSVGMGLAGLAQLREKKICKPRVTRLGHQSNPLNFKAEERYQRRLDRLPEVYPFQPLQFHISRPPDTLSGNTMVPAKSRNPAGTERLYLSTPT